MTRIRTTHVGSLPRSQAVVDFLFAKERGEAVDASAFDACMAGAVSETVRRQVEAGVDIVSDGETSKISYATYVSERYTGFAGDSPRQAPADLKMFPGYLERIARSGGTPRYARPECRGRGPREGPRGARPGHREPPGGDARARRRARVHERRLPRGHRPVPAQPVLPEPRRLSWRPRRRHARGVRAHRGGGPGLADRLSGSGARPAHAVHGSVRRRIRGGGSSQRRGPEPRPSRRRPRSGPGPHLLGQLRGAASVRHRHGQGVCGPDVGPRPLRAVRNLQPPPRTRSGRCSGTAGRRSPTTGSWCPAWWIPRPISSSIRRWLPNVSTAS